MGGLGRSCQGDTSPLRLAGKGVSRLERGGRDSGSKCRSNTRDGKPKRTRKGTPNQGNYKYSFILNLTTKPGTLVTTELLPTE